MLLLYTSKTGNNKLKLQCIAKNRRSVCFKHVNMKSLPDYKQFQCLDNMRCFFLAVWQWLNFISQTLFSSPPPPPQNRYKDFIIVESLPPLPSLHILKSKDENIREMFLPTNTTPPMQELLERAEHSVAYTAELQTQNCRVTVFLKTLPPKHVDPAGLVCGRVSPTTNETTS